MGCTNLIDPRHRRQKFCSDACRQKDGRELRAATRRDKPPALCARCKKELKQKATAAADRLQSN